MPSRPVPWHVYGCRFAAVNYGKEMTPFFIYYFERVGLGLGDSSGKGCGSTATSRARGIAAFRKCAPSTTTYDLAYCTNRQDFAPAACSQSRASSAGAHAV